VPPEPREPRLVFHSVAERQAEITRVEAEMRAAAANLDFERAASLRDRLKLLRTGELGLNLPAAG
jgi:excinuclease UvrABC helicase subunit UvrB